MPSGSVAGPLVGQAAPPTATRVEAPPPKPLSSATIWGIAVISMRSARKAPMAEPTTMPARITG